MKKKLFWLVARTAFALYKTFPVFGDLRASVGIIEDGGRFLVILRNDGRGYSFPGGIARPFEAETATLLREIQEETGLQAERWNLLFRYRTDVDIPCVISVFRVTARGTLRSSWEGTPCWETIPDLSNRITRSQLPVLERILSPAAQPPK
jgi:8-oxo-dGTP pyrophosphatase MutT (NUDIX family)